ncbi:MAG: stage II sporulation protein M [Candidatus Methanoperedens sp.]|nr:stage II sporulation protein M [Candidatus Methanoperedens sp.]MCE8427370.1 stage II sporulation protein M [Candidatus Methanoperedens sp.]
MGNDLDYLRSSTKYIILMTIIFILSMIAGLLVAIKYPGLSAGYLKEFEGSYGWLKTVDPLLIMLVIFANNALKSLAALVMGAALGIIPILFVIGNGMIISILADAVSRQHGTLFVIKALLPHGIIEVPMILISTGIGLRIGHLMFMSFMGQRADIKKELKMGTGFFLRRIAPLLFVAAFIETFVTPYIVMFPGP